MTLALIDLERRDARIAELEAKGEDRTIAERIELADLHQKRDHHWRRLPQTLAFARRRARDLEVYGRRHFLQIDEVRA